MIAVGILGGIILISVACLTGIYLYTSRGADAAQQAQAANAAATQTAQAFIDQSLTATFEASILPTTTVVVTVPPTVTPPVAQPSATRTPDPMSGLSGTQAAATATVGAAYTQAAAAALTVYPTTTALPDGGFADEYGLPGLVVMALAFVIVILFARRMRTAPTR